MLTIASLLNLSLSTTFLTYVGAICAILVGVMLQHLPTRTSLAGVGIIAIGIVYAGTLGYAGIIGDPTLMPPGIFILLAPIVTFVFLVIGRSNVGRDLAAMLPIATILALQSFRVGVELTLSSLHDAGMVPRLLTLAGGNVEILVGLSAPIMALVATRGALGQRVALAWNVVGLLSLLNVAGRAALTAPGPLNFIHTSPPNMAMGTFPFSLIPGFMAPLAMVLHVLAFRALRASKAAGSASAGKNLLVYVATSN